jgi:transposase InsO family protein
MVLFDTGCSDQLVSPQFAQWLIAKGARWRYCDPLPMEHGNKAATRAAAPADKQICIDVFLVHQGHQYLSKDVWFYIYDGTLPDAMLSDGFLRSIPCISDPGRKLLDTSSNPTDEAQVRNHVYSLRQNYDDIVAYHMSRCSAHSGSINASVAGQAATPAAAADAAPHSSDQIKALLAEMAEQRERLRERLGKPVSQEALAACQSVLDRFPNIFKPPGSTPCKLGVFRIVLKDQSKFHIALPRRVNAIMLQEIRRQVEELVAQGAIERVTTRPSSVYAIVMARRPNAPGKFRLCIDLKPLNDNTVPIPYAIPEIHAALDRLSGHKLYCTFDFTSWFHQFEIAAEDRDKVAFIVPGDHLSPPQIYRFKRVAFGLMNATYFCQRQLQEALEKWPGCEGIFPFVDDIVIAADSVDEMCQKLESFCSFCQHYGICLKREKSELAAAAVKHVGFILSEDGKALDPARVDSLLNIKAPGNLKDLKSLLGSFSFIRGWLANCADIAAPLTDMMSTTARNLGFSWGPEQDAALDALKLAVQLAPATHAPDYSLPFHVFVDASDVGVAAVLMQWKPNAAGDIIPAAILHVSRRWSAREARWSNSEHEMYALKYGMEKFRDYLQLCPDVTLHTDHLNIVTGLWQHSSPKIERWRMYLESCRPFKLRHIKGTSDLQRPADCLSRLHAKNFTEPITADEDDEEAQLEAEGGSDHPLFGSCNAAQLINHFIDKEHRESVLPCIPLADRERAEHFEHFGQGRGIFLQAIKKRAIEAAHSWHPRYQPRAHELFAAAQRKPRSGAAAKHGIGFPSPAPAQVHHVACCNAILSIEHVADVDEEGREDHGCDEAQAGLIAAVQATQTTAEDFRATAAKARGGFPHEEVLKRAHDLTHPSFAATWRRVIRGVGHQDISTMTALRKEVQHYVNSCLVCQKILPARERLAARIGIIRQRPFTRYAFDLIVMSEPDLEGKRYILVCVDSFSRAVELFALSRGDAESVATALHDVLSRWGRPLEVCCDNARAFSSSVVSSLLKMARVESHLVAPYSHNSNGQVENCNRRVNQVLRALVLDDYLGPNSRLRWSLLLPQVRRVIMTRTINQHGCTPNDLAYMHAPETEDSIFAEEDWLPPREAEEPRPEWVQHLKSQHEAIILKCEEHQDKLLADLAEESERQLASIKSKPLQVGEFVLLKMEERPHKKDNAPWAGPYEVLEQPDNDPLAPVVLAQHIATKAVGRFAVSMLKRCDLSHLRSIDEAIPIAAKDSFEYVVQEIQAHRPTGQRRNARGKLRPKSDYEFQVLWRDFPLGEDNPTWEPWDNVSLRSSEPFLEYCARPDVAAQLGADFAL